MIIPENLFIQSREPGLRNYSNVNKSVFEGMSLSERIKLFDTIPTLKVEIFKADVVWMGSQIIHSMQNEIRKLL